MPQAALWFALLQADHEIKVIDWMCRVISTECCVLNWVGHQDTITSQREFKGKKIVSFPWAKGYCRLWRRLNISTGTGRKALKVQEWPGGLGGWLSVSRREWKISIGSQTWRKGRESSRSLSWLFLANVVIIAVNKGVTGCIFKVNKSTSSPGMQAGRPE